MKKRMTRKQFKELFEEEIKDFGYESIRENEDYFDGYPYVNEEFEEEIFDSNYEEFVDELAEELGVEINESISD